MQPLRAFLFFNGRNKQSPLRNAWPRGKADAGLAKESGGQEGLCGGEVKYPGNREQLAFLEPQERQFTRGTPPCKHAAHMHKSCLHRDHTSTHNANLNAEAQCTSTTCVSVTDALGDATVCTYSPLWRSCCHLGRNTKAEASTRLSAVTNALLSTSTRTQD